MKESLRAPSRRASRPARISIAPELERITLHDSPTISVWCYPEARIIHHRMHGHCFGQALRAGLYAGTEGMRAHGATGWLSDDRANGPLAPDEETWAAHEWFPATKAAGWTTWALVKPRSAIGQLSMNRFVKLYESLGITAQFFVDPAAALAWLREQAGCSSSQ
jgi:hypothetical protein